MTYERLLATILFVKGGFMLGVAPTENHPILVISIGIAYIITGLVFTIIDTREKKNK